jgi:hypothetical protein
MPHDNAHGVLRQKIGTDREDGSPGYGDCSHGVDDVGLIFDAAAAGGRDSPTSRSHGCVGTALIGLELVAAKTGAGGWLDAVVGLTRAWVLRNCFPQSILIDFNEVRTADSLSHFPLEFAFVLRTDSFLAFGLIRLAKMRDVAGVQPLQMGQLAAVSSIGLRTFFVKRQRFGARRLRPVTRVDHTRTPAAGGNASMRKESP